jgi:23S rRNA pseudouridine1911/1915/1917 synthase
LDILYEDSDMIVINKPAGLVDDCLRSGKGTYRISLADRLRADEEIHGNRIFAVHRLDRDTSGVLMFAKNERMKLALQDNWADLVSERALCSSRRGTAGRKNAAGSAPG